MRWQMTIALLALAACEKQHSPQDQAVRDAHAVAAVKEANRSAIKPIDPELILFPDIEDNQLQGAGCAFAPGAGVGAVMLSRAESAYMKLDDKVVSFTSDAGSPALPEGTHTKYRGNNLTLEISADLEGAPASGPAQATYPGRLTARDLDGNVVYDQPGSLQCGA